MWRADYAAAMEAAALDEDLTKAETAKGEAVARREAWLRANPRGTDTPEGMRYLAGVSDWLARQDREVIPGILRARDTAKTRDTSAGPSAFAAEARRMSWGEASPWARPDEVFARAFEALVQDGLSEAGAVSEWLVHGCEEGRYANGFRGRPHPEGQERARLGRLLAPLIDACLPMLDLAMGRVAD
jgi:hypothetical protein